MADTNPGAGTPAPGPRPALIHIADQTTAKLRDLVQLVRDHRDAHGCDPVLACPGEWAVRELASMSCLGRFGILAVALAELEALGYGLPARADRYELTEAAQAALDEAGGTDG